MKKLKKEMAFILLLVFPVFMTMGCSSDDSSEPKTEKEEDKKDPGTSVFEAVINFPDEDQELEFKATDKKAKAYLGEYEIENKVVPNVILMEMEDNDSPQILFIVTTEIKGEGTYIMGKEGFEIAVGVYAKDKDKDDADVKDNLYTFHKQELDLGDEKYHTEAKLTITSLTDDRIKGTLDIIMYSSVLEYEGAGEDKTFVGGFAHKGVVSAEFDCALEKDLD